MKSLWLVCSLVFVNIEIECNSCHNNRKVFTAKTGVIKDNLYDKPSLRCEWLIKGEVGETVSISFDVFESECGYDYLFVYDGGSHSSKVIASLSGSHTGFSLTSQSHMMLLRFHSDSGILNMNFYLTYTINNCPNNCSGLGKCLGGKCECLKDRSYSFACQHTWCPQICNQAYGGNNSCDVSSRKCLCGAGLYGESCSISDVLNVGLNTWHTISSFSNAFTSRAGHVVGYISLNNAMLLHGGYALSEVFDDTLMFDFKLNEWTKLTINSLKPVARYSHASDMYKDNLIIYGGELANYTLSNELWLFNSSSLTWNLLSENKTIPALTGHTLTLAGTKLYLFGGRSNASVSSKMFVFDLISKTWAIKINIYGRESDRRLFGHSACYHKEQHSIVVFGGYHVVSSGVNAVLSNRVLIYNIKANIWSIIKSSESSFNLPPYVLAYHTATVVGAYMIVYGGITTGKLCKLSNEIFCYNLNCHVWVSKHILTPKDGRQYKPKARYSHSAIAKDEQTIVFVGGYTGAVMLNDVIAYKVPKTIAYYNESSQLLIYGSHCHLYATEESCLNDPSCGLCSTSSKCYATQYSSHCNDGSFVIKNCKSLCDVISYCEECVMTEQCKWCTLDSKCYRRNETKCSQDLIGWWGSKTGKILSSAEECQLYDRPPGLMYKGYLDPPNYDYPDVVKVIQSTHTTISRKEHVFLNGFVYPYFRYTNGVYADHDVRLNGLYTTSILNVSVTNRSLKQRTILHNVNVLRTVNVVFPVKPNDHTNVTHLWYLLTLDTVADQSNAWVAIQWKPTRNSSFPFTQISKNNLELFHSNECSNYMSCMACISDASCGWCPLNNLCLFRHSWQDCKDPNNVVTYLSRDQSQCVKCEHYIDCVTCVQDAFCVWQIKVDKQQCYRKERKTTTTINSMSECASSCESRKYRSSCLITKGCIWCTNKQACLPHSQHELQNNWGQCGTFYDSIRTIPAVCGTFLKCADCVRFIGCGWCHLEFDPRKGKCTEGDFVVPSTNCSVALHGYPLNISGSLSWSYAQCQDVNECLLKIDICGNNSKCVNTVGSYACPCNPGYEGDAKVSSCKRICWPRCIHGTCDESVYKCECHLGWKGVNCSIDCGCNQHSTCFNQTGICDRCQGNTVGKNCEFCVNGSYGNATTSAGCKPCDCNHHGDESLGYCNKTDGTCFCKNNTAGKNCEKCIPGFSGDPKVGICYLHCSRSNIVMSATPSYLAPSHPEINSLYTKCTWTLSASPVNQTGIIYGKLNVAANILLKLISINMSCFDSHLVIYDGVPPNPQLPQFKIPSKFKHLATVCGYQNENRMYRSENGFLTIVYEGKTGQSVIDTTYKSAGFVSHYTGINCPLNCPLPFVCLHGICTCKDGWYGLMCKYKTCSVCLNGGICNKVTYTCQCKLDFTGIDCGLVYSSEPFLMQDLYGMYIGLTEDDIARFGNTIHLYGSSLYLFGGSNFERISQYTLIKYDLRSSKWFEVEAATDVKPSSRYFHCSFMYENAMFIYGGVTSIGISSELWKYDFLTNTWTHIQNFQALVGHTCTIVGKVMYILGGYSPSDGLNEFIFGLNLLTMNIIVHKFDGLAPAGFYSHVAVFDEVSGNIFVYGGIAFHEEDIQPSSRVYAFSIKKNEWNYIEHMPGEAVPTLFGHSAFLIGDMMFVAGGYDNKFGFNSDVYVWKIRCNHWTKIQRKSQHWQGNGQTDFMFLSSVVNFSTVYIFGGFHSSVSLKLTIFKVDSDLCNRHQSNKMCLQESGCSWCQMNSTKFLCFNNTAPSWCLLNTTGYQIGKSCDVNTAKRRSCSTYTQCHTCLAGYPDNRDECQWCRCKKTQCLSKAETCDCRGQKKITECFETQCEASSCHNCDKNECFWTTHLRVKSEVGRTFQKNMFPYNCFSQQLLLSKGLEREQRNLLSKVLPCPSHCKSYTSCQACLNGSVKGDFAGSRNCIWSQKLSLCLSVALIPFNCSFGKCGQLFTTQNMCPNEDCSVNTRCLSCMEKVHCGWCARGTQGEGVCLDGYLEEPSKEECGSLRKYIDGPTIVSNSSVNYTWAYVVCPLENECENGHSTCKANENCYDLVDGYHCQCKDGYKRIKSKCIPQCPAGCGNGSCMVPGKCNCSFGWTGSTCDKQCLCNGHSNCLDETNLDVCLDCHDNTQGLFCEECNPLFVGDPRDGRKCVPCHYICNNKADICILKTEKLQIKYKKWDKSLASILARGPQHKKDVICIDCGKDSEGDLCESCINGYFKLGSFCTKCMCNGHSSTCNKTNGDECACGYNTKANPTCKKDCFNEQCNHCKTDYIGKPINHKQCYKKMNTKSVEKVALAPGQTSFFVASPGYTNVNIRIIVDVYQGEFDVYLADTDETFALDINDTTSEQHLRFLAVKKKKRRSVNDDTDVFYNRLKSRTRRAILLVNQVNAVIDRISTFTKYTGDILYIKNVKKRVVITVQHNHHDLGKKWFYGVLSSINKTSVSQAHVYYRQDLPRIDLLLFFLVLTVILFLILSGFVLGWKLRADVARQRLGNQVQIELQNMASRPLATYCLQCDRNEDIDIMKKRKGRRNTTSKTKLLPAVAPLAVQNTSDNLASILTVVLRYPENELSSWNICLASGLSTAHNQQLIQIKSSNNGAQGRRVNTRILNTTT